MFVVDSIFPRLSHLGIVDPTNFPSTRLLMATSRDFTDRGCLAYGVPTELFRTGFLSPGQVFGSADDGPTSR